jgi:hypothetical protein
MDKVRAWFMCHRIRYAMMDKNPGPLSGIVEADETYVGGNLRGHHKHRALATCWLTATHAPPR